MKKPRNQYYFLVTITAEDGTHPKRFYGLDMKTANRAIAYATSQLGRKICENVPSEEWLENNNLGVYAVCDYGRTITLEQGWFTTGAVSVPPAPTAKPMTAQEEWEHKEAMAEYQCLHSDGFDPRAPFPHDSDPHWSDPRADFSHF